MLIDNKSHDLQVFFLQFNYRNNNASWYSSCKGIIKCIVYFSGLLEYQYILCISLNYHGLARCTRWFVINFVSVLRQVKGFFLVLLVSFYKTNHQERTEILLKVAFKHP